LGLVDKPLARPPLGLHAISAACPEACCLTQRTRPTLTLSRGSSLRFATLQHIEAKEPFSSSGRCQTSGRLCRAFQKPHPQGLATLSAVLALLPSEASFSFPRSWASLSRALLQPHGRAALSRGPSALTLPYQTRRLDTGASAVSAHEASRSSCPGPYVESQVESVLS
jgi:hypothetical protein